MSSPSDSAGNDQLLGKAIECQKAGRVAEAEQLYLAVLKGAPDHVAALHRLGILYFQNGKATQALPFLETARKLQPQNSAILNSLGIASQVAGRDKDSIVHFRQALAITPGDTGTLDNLGRALREQGDSKPRWHVLPSLFRQILRALMPVWKRANASLNWAILPKPCIILKPR